MRIGATGPRRSWPRRDQLRGAGLGAALGIASGAAFAVALNAYRQAGLALTKREMEQLLSAGEGEHVEGGRVADSGRAAQVCPERGLAVGAGRA